MGNIIIHSDFGRKLLELTEDELIIKRFLHKKRVKRSNIRSAYMWGNSLNILTYDNKFITAGYIFIKWSERDNIKRIIDEISKEDILFNLNKDTFPLWITFYCFPSVSNLIDDWGRRRYFSWIVLIVMVILLFIIYKERLKNRRVYYYISDRKFKWLKGRDKLTKNYSIEDTNLVKDYDMMTKYKFKDEKDTFKMIKKIDYPLSYKMALEEIMTVASGKGSLEKL